LPRINKIESAPYKYQYFFKEICGFNCKLKRLKVLQSFFEIQSANKYNDLIKGSDEFLYFMDHFDIKNNYLPRFIKVIYNDIEFKNFNKEFIGFYFFGIKYTFVDGLVSNLFP